MPVDPRVLVVVVTYNSARTVERCLASLAAQEGVAADLVVVDNASTDDTLARVRALPGSVRTVASAENLGFGRANNLAVAGLDAPFVAFVNPDAFVDPLALRTCCDALLARPALGVVGLRHVDDAGREQPSAFPFLSLRGLLGEALGLDRVLPRSGGFSSRRIDGFDPARPADVDWIQGSFLVARAEAVRRAGGFDPRIFMYAEDMEWCFRVRRAGYGIACLPAPAVVHLGGASAKGQEPRLYVEHWKGRLLFFDLHRGPLARLAARALIALSIGLRWTGLEVAGSRDDPRRALFRAGMRWLLAGQPLPRARP